MKLDYSYNNKIRENYATKEFKEYSDFLLMAEKMKLLILSFVIIRNFFQFFSIYYLLKLLKINFYISMCFHVKNN